jgi:GNAT superfamily N-acetyltransferase
MMTSTTYRPGTMADTRAIYDVFTQATSDLERRMGSFEMAEKWADPTFIEDYWVRRGPLFEHLARSAAHFWVAEQDWRIVGFARSTLHDGVLELVDFFVLPGHQSTGVGRELLARAFPRDGARRRAIIASTDIRALARYLKSGVYPRFPIYYFYRMPLVVEIETGLEFRPAGETAETLAAIREIDWAILGFERDEDHEFLLKDRQPYLFYRGERVAGYGYFGKGTGPVALLDEADFPAVLARAETEAAARGDDEYGMYVPLINRAAVDYLLRQGFKMEDFTVLFMSDEAFGRFENYVITSPPFFI